MDLSLVIPVKDEEKSLPVLYREILTAVKPLAKSWEIIFVDDGSTDRSAAIIGSLQKRDRRILLIKFRGNFGKSAALSAGFEKARGEVIITLDADLQDDPAELPKFLTKINAGYDLVCGWKKKRLDPPGKVIPSRFWNLMAAALSGVKIHDFNCGFKAYRQEVAKSLPLYGELYRLIPILAAEKKFRITEIPVHHRPRVYGQSKFGWERFIKGFLDLITILFLTKFARRPAHFFGGLGFFLTIFGLAIGVYIAYLRLAFGDIQGRQPLLLAGMLLILVGIQLISTGLLAEMLVFLNPRSSAGKQK